MSTLIGALHATLGLDSANFQSGLARSQSSAGTFEKAMVRMAARLGAALGAALSIRGYARVADEWSDMSSRVGAATGNMEGAAAQMRDILRLANASYSSLSDTVNVFASNVGPMRDLGYSTQQTTDFTESLNHMLVTTATRGQRATAVQNALSRAMATGRLRGDGLNTVMADGSRVAQAIAEELGVTTSELYELAAQGRITGDVIARSVLRSLEQVREEAGNMPTTIADGFLKIGNGLTALIGSFDKATGISGAVAGMLDSIAKGLGDLAGADWSAFGQSIATGAEIAAQALLVLSATRIPALVAASLGLARTGAVIIWFNVMAAGSLRAAAAMVAQAVAARGLSIAGAALTLVMRGLSAAMALAGGPIGLVAAVLAAAAVAWYRFIPAVQGARDYIGLAGAAQEALNDALSEFNRTRSPEAREHLIAQAAATREQAAASLAAAQAELALMQAEAARFAAAPREERGLLGDLVDSNISEGIVGAQDELIRLMGLLVDAEVALAAARGMGSDAASNATAAAAALTAEQRKALEISQGMIRDYERRAELSRLELAYGRDSAAYQEAVARHTREDVRARLEAADATEEMVRATLDALDAAERTERAVAAWGNMTDEVRKRVLLLQGNLLAVANMDVGDSFMSRGMARLAQMAGLALQVAAANGGTPPSTGDDGVGSSLTATGSGGGRGRREELGADIRRDIEMMRAEADALNNLELSHNDYALAVERARREAQMLQELQREGVQLTPEVRARVAELTQEWYRNSEALAEARTRHDEFRSALDDFRSTAEGAFVGLVTGANSFRDALARVLMQLAEMAASRAFAALWSGGMGSKAGGVLRSIMGFDQGGFTGDGPATAVAGVVHGGEYVFSKRAVDRIGLGALEAMHGRAKRGFMSGGYVSTGGGALASASLPREAAGLAFSGGELTLSDSGEIVGQIRVEMAQGLKDYDKGMPGRISRQIAHPRKR